MGTRSVAVLALLIGSIVATISAQTTPARGVVHGVFVDGATGAPIDGVHVTLTTYDPRSEKKISSDRNGAFRITGLRPGTYHVGIYKDRHHPGWRGFQTPTYHWYDAIEIVDDDVITGAPIRLWRTATVSGIVRGQRGERLPARISARSVPQSPDEKVPPVGWLGIGGADYRGRFSIELMPGRYRLVASPDHTIRVDMRKGEPVRARLDVFLPGVRDSARATIFDLAPGQQLRGVEVVIPSVPAFDISGRVSGGAVTEAGVDIKPFVDLEGDDVTGTCSACSLSTAAQPDGSFVLSAVPAGRYRLISSRRSGGHVSFGDSEGLRAAADVEIVDRNVDNLALTLEARTQITAKIVRIRDGRTDLPAIDERASVFDASGQRWISRTPRGTDRSVVVWPRLPPGPFVVRASDQGWQMRSATLNGRDITDRPFDVGEAPISDLVITLSPVAETPRLSGTVRGADGRPVRNAHVVVFPTDESFWTPFAERRIRNIGIRMNGVLHPLFLPRGEYFLAAVAPEDLEDWPTPAGLVRLSRKAQRVTLADGQELVVALTVVAR